MIADVLAQVAAAVSVDACRLVEFSETGSVARTHAPARTTNGSGVQQETPSPDERLVARLARGETVIISPAGDPTAAAFVSRERAAPRAGACFVLGLPAAVSGQVVCALVIESGHVPRQWSEAAHRAAAARRRDSRRRGPALPERDGTAVERGRDQRLNAKLQADNVYLKEEIKSYHDVDEIVGESAPLRLALARLSQVAPTNSTVLLLGETGTGKELFARALHERSRRHARPFVGSTARRCRRPSSRASCSATRRAPSPAPWRMRQGRFELADGGTIFLDEIGELPPEIQVKLLRVLQEGEFERVGRHARRRVDVRVIAATHRDLETAVADGTLPRRPLLPPERVPIPCRRCASAPRTSRGSCGSSSTATSASSGATITKVPQAVMDALSSTLAGQRARAGERGRARDDRSTGDTLQLENRCASARRAPPQRRADSLDAVQRVTSKRTARCGWRINGAGNAAVRLGMHPNTLRFRMKKLGVVCPESRRRRPNRADASQPRID